MDSKSFMFVVSASSTYVPGTGFVPGEPQAPSPPPGLLADVFSGVQSGWSVRKLRDSYNGPCMRVRRTSDSKVKDIGFVDNYIDIAELNSFMVDANDTARVVTWFDQVGSFNLNRHRHDFQPSVTLTTFIGDKVAVDFSDHKGLLNATGPDFKFITATFRLNRNNTNNPGTWPSNCTILDGRELPANADPADEFRKGTTMHVNTTDMKRPLPISFRRNGTLVTKPYDFRLIEEPITIAIRPNDNVCVGYTVGNYTDTKGGNHLMSEIVLWDVNKASVAKDISRHMNDFFHIYFDVIDAIDFPIF